MSVFYLVRQKNSSIRQSVMGGTRKMGSQRLVFALRSWWRNLDIADLLFLVDRGSCEGWIKFALVLGARDGSMPGYDETSAIRFERSLLADVLLNEDAVEIKLVQNNKNLPAKVHATRADITKLRQRRLGARAVLVIFAFHNMRGRSRAEREGFGPHYGETSRLPNTETVTRLQPPSAGVRFGPFASRLARSFVQVVEPTAPQRILDRALAPADSERVWLGAWIHGV